MKKIVVITIVMMLLFISTPIVIGSPEETNNDEWKIVAIKGQCTSWSCGTIFHVFSLWSTLQQMSFYGVTEDTEMKINGELYPIDDNSYIRFNGFIGKSILVVKWIIYEKYEIEPPYDFTVFGLARKIEISPNPF